MNKFVGRDGPGAPSPHIAYQQRAKSSRPTDGNYFFWMKASYSSAVSNSP